MKKRILALMLALILVISSLASCTTRYGIVSAKGKITVVVEYGEAQYEVYTAMLEDIEDKSEGFMCVLRHMSSREEDPLPLTLSENRFGQYVSAIGPIEQDIEAGDTIIVYTTVSSDSYSRASEVKYGEKTLYQSGLGMKGMSALADSIILFRLENQL
jgi:hypothetical protein